MKILPLKYRYFFVRFRNINEQQMKRPANIFRYLEVLIYISSNRSQTTWISKDTEENISLIC